MSTHFTYEDRIRLETMLKNNFTKSEIAKQLHKSRQSIYNEIKRGQYTRYTSQLEKTQAYSPIVAQERADYMKTAKGAPMKLTSVKIADVIEELILNDYSPYAVTVEIFKQFQFKICPGTLYSYIEKGIFRSITKKHLPRGKSTKKYEKVVRYPRIHNILKSIKDRPEHINQRQTFGHWEMDSVIGVRDGKHDCLLTLTERKTLYELKFRLTGKEQDKVIAALNRLEMALKLNFRKIFKSITTDNGNEFLNFKGIEASVSGSGTRTTQYFCNPYSSWERGQNENQNGMIRRKIKKGTLIESYSDEYLKDSLKWLNNYPRKKFNGLSALDMLKLNVNDDEIIDILTNQLPMSIY